MATIIIRPNGDNSIGNWVNSDSGTSNLYSYIDEETLSTVDYVRSVITESQSDSVLFNFENISLNNPTINKIKIYCNRTNSEEAITTKKIRLKIGSTNYDFSEIAISGDEFYVELLENPATTSGWTEEDINSLIVGYYHATESSKGNTSTIFQLYIEVDYTEVIDYDFYLWSVDTLPWQLSLPWQYQNGWVIIGAVTNYIITGIGSIFTRLINLLTSASSYTITGVNSILSRLRNLIASATSYSITGINATLLWETAKVLVAEVANYSITTINSILSRLRNLFTSTTNYSITTINSILTICRCFFAGATAYSITTFNSIISRPIRNLLASVSEYVIGSTGVGLYKGWGMLCESTSYLITGINSILSKALNLFTANTEYVITTIEAIIQRLVILITATTNYSITTVGSIFTKALNLFLSLTEYSIIGVNTTLSRLRNLITEKSEYIITGIDTDLLRPIRNFIVNTTAYIISTFSVSFRGTGDWLWRWVAKPSASNWSNGNKSTNTYNNVTKPSSDWTNKTKIE